MMLNVETAIHLKKVRSFRPVGFKPTEGPSCLAIVMPAVIQHGQKRDHRRHTHPQEQQQQSYPGRHPGVGDGHRLAESHRYSARAAANAITAPISSAAPID